MSKEQIEEMARVIMDTPPLTVRSVGRAQGKRYMTAHHLAEHLYNADYRKQSEWISVDERLPEEDMRVLVYINSERSYTKLDTDRMADGKWVRWSKDITHWMPLPEAPNMKGGAE